MVLLPSNFSGADGLRHLTAELGALGREAGLPAPLLVCLNQEGGRASAVHDGVPEMPSELVLGSGGGRHRNRQERCQQERSHEGFRFKQGERRALSLGEPIMMARVSERKSPPVDPIPGEEAVRPSKLGIRPGSRDQPRRPCYRSPTNALERSWLR